MHLMTTRVDDRSAELSRLSEDIATSQELSRADTLKNPLHKKGERPEVPWRGGGKLPDGALPAGGRHPRDVRILPKSRDFH